MELLSASRGFLKCNFHCHTTCSDGRLSPKDVMAAYRALDYDVLAITDHRAVTRPAADEIPAGLMLIPGTAFDRAGGRIGQGGGYYDRYILKTRAFRVGVCHGFALMDSVPTEKHDARMDAVVTPEETLIFRQEERT